jgi:hypothetical protein
MATETEADTKQNGYPAVAAAGSGNAQANIRYIDRSDCIESFADSISSLYFDGQTLRIEFGVTRLDDVKPNQPISGRRIPTQRMVLTPSAAVELINRMQQVATALTQAGLLKANPKPT